MLRKLKGWPNGTVVPFFANCEKVSILDHGEKNSVNTEMG